MGRDHKFGGIKSSFPLYFSLQGTTITDITTATTDRTAVNTGKITFTDIVTTASYIQSDNVVTAEADNVVNEGLECFTLALVSASLPTGPPADVLGDLSSTTVCIVDQSSKILIINNNPNPNILSNDKKCCMTIMFFLLYKELNIMCQQQKTRTKTYLQGIFQTLQSK
jgi:hypothetical protein